MVGVRPRESASISGKKRLLILNFGFRVQLKPWCSEARCNHIGINPFSNPPISARITGCETETQTAFGQTAGTPYNSSI